MNFNRALHPDDYKELEPWVSQLLDFKQEMRRRGLVVREDHAHRLWEYSSVLQQLDALLLRDEHPPFNNDLRILDTGSGGSYLPCYLATRGYAVEVSDSMAYGEIEEAFLSPQRNSLGIRLPLIRCPVEKIQSEDEVYDVTMCISVIEHVDQKFFNQALRELVRVTKHGGFIFITSDFFKDRWSAELSPFRSIQHNIFTPDNVIYIENVVPARFIGGKDFTYRGDWVNNYSFVNICLQKPF